MREEDFINNFLRPLSQKLEGSLSLGDDAAILPHSPGKEMIVSKDILHAGQHFFESDEPENIAHKALAVNLSDIAAKGAAPSCFMLGIAFPKAPEEIWCERFATGLHAISQRFDCPLLGGDTTGTKGPLSLSITIFGEVEQGRMVKRSSAKVGDQLYVSGSLGNAALGYLLKANQIGFEPPELDLLNQTFDVSALELSTTQQQDLLKSFLRPEPRINLTSAIRNFASAAMDISDGLLTDLPKLCTASDCGAKVEIEKIPFSEAAAKVLAQSGRAKESLRELCLSWGDDYEILSAIPPEAAKQFESEARKSGINVQKIGTVTKPENGIELRDKTGNLLELNSQHFAHF